LQSAAWDKRARAEQQLARAVGRAKDALLVDLCADIAATVADLRRRLLVTTADASLQDHLAVDGANAGDWASRFSSEMTRLEVLGGTTLQMARLLSDEIMVADRKSDLGEIVACALEDIESERALADLRLELIMPPTPVAVTCHGESLQAAMRQLLRNAVQYSPHGGSLRVTTQIHEDGMLTFDVTDAGEGMHPDFIAFVLGIQATQQPHRSRILHSGFGLPLAKAIIEAHGGALEIRSMLGEGTSAMIVLPADRVYTTPVAP